MNHLSINYFRYISHVLTIHIAKRVSFLSQVHAQKCVNPLITNCHPETIWLSRDALQAPETQVSEPQRHILELKGKIQNSKCSILVLFHTKQIWSSHSTRKKSPKYLQFWIQITVIFSTICQNKKLYLGCIEYVLNMYIPPSKCLLFL